MNQFHTRFILWCLLLGGGIEAIAQPNNQRVTGEQKHKPAVEARIDSLWQSAEALSTRHHNEAALVMYRRAQKLARRYDEPLRLANLYADASAVFANQVRYPEALAECQRGLAVLPQAQPGQDSVRFKLYTSLAYCHYALNNPDSAQYFFNRIENLLAESPLLEARIPAYVLNYYVAVGITYNAQGDYTPARTYFEKALQLARKYHQEDYFQVLYNNLATYYQSVGEYQKAIGYYHEGLQHSGVMHTQLLSNLGKLYLETRRYPEALRCLNQARTRYQRLQKNDFSQRNPEIEARIYSHLGTAYTRLGQWHQGKNYLDAALRLNRRTFGPHHQRVSETYLCLGEWYQAQQMVPQSLAEYERAIGALFGENSPRDSPLNGGDKAQPDEERAVSAVTLFEVLRRKAALLSGSPGQPQNLRAALGTYQVALRVSERLRRSYDAADAKLFFTNTVYPVYEEALGVAYGLYEQTRQSVYAQAAFVILESSKAATLSDALREARIKPSTLPAALLKDEKALNHQLTDLKLQLAAARQPDQVRAIQAQLLDKELKLTQLLRQFERISPQYYRVKYGVKPLPLTQLQQQLPDNHTALVSYFMGTRHIYTFVVSREGTALQRWPVLASLRPALAQLRRELYTNPRLGLYRGSKAAQEAYGALMRPLEGNLRGIGRLIILPDGELHYLPFDVLEPAPNHYLLHRFAFRYAYSATLLFGMGHPPLATNERVLAVAPYADSIGLAVPLRSGGLGALPASRGEAERVGDVVLLNAEATKEAFLAQYRQYGVLHLATHAYADDQDPAQSYIAFHPRKREFKLFTNELYNLLLEKARLVVLSACETGNGQLQRGEGTLSLARAFVYAGCPSVVTTLWNAHDESAAYLSTHLYEGLRAGLPLDEALRQAKIGFIDEAENQPFNHPYYWANLVLIGDGGPVFAMPVAAQFPAWAIGGAAGGLVLVILVGWGLWRQQKKGEVLVKQADIVLE